MPIANAVLASLIAGMATGLGGVLVVSFGKLNMRAYDTLLGFAAGVMTAVATLGLIHEAISDGGAVLTLVGVAGGAAALFAFDRYLPHEHERLPFECTNPLAFRRGMLLLTAMVLHNIPEGLAVGSSFMASPRLGLLLALAIAGHNIPEGIAVAGPFRACGMGRLRCIAWTIASGLAEPFGALLGASFVTVSASLVPATLAFAAGAMLYVVSDELIPESHSHGFEHQATFGFVVGFMVLMALLRWSS